MLVQIPSAGLWIPVRFHYIAASVHNVNENSIQEQVAAQLSILNKGFSGTTGGCGGTCVDTGIRFVSVACSTDPDDCTTLPVHVRFASQFGKLSSL